MPRELVELYRCSLCPAQSIGGEGFTSFVMHPAEGTKPTAMPKPLGFDVCEPCLKGEELSRLLAVGYPIGRARKANQGRGTKAEAETAEAEATPDAYVCGCGHTSPKPQGLAAHQRWCGKTEAEVAALKAQTRAARAAAKAARS